MELFWKIVVGIVASFTGAAAIHLAQRKPQTPAKITKVTEIAAESPKRAKTPDAVKEPNGVGTWFIPQGTFWDRTGICYSILFKHLQDEFELNDAAEAKPCQNTGELVRNMLEASGPDQNAERLVTDENLSFLLNVFKFDEKQTAINLSRWNLCDGTFEMEYDGKLFGARIPKMSRYRVIALRGRSIQVVDELHPNTPIFINMSLNVSVPFDFLQTRERKRTGENDWYIDISDLLDPAKTTIAEFHRIFSAPKSTSTSCSTTDIINFTDLAKMIDNNVYDHTQLPTVLRQLTLHYAN